MLVFFKIFPVDRMVKEMLMIVAVRMIQSEHLPRNLKVYSCPPIQSKITSECHNQQVRESLSLTCSVFLVTQIF